MAQFHATFHGNSTAILSGLQARYEGGGKAEAREKEGSALVLLPPHHVKECEQKGIRERFRWRQSNFIRLMCLGKHTGSDGVAGAGAQCFVQNKHLMDDAELGLGIGGVLNRNCGLGQSVHSAVTSRCLEWPGL